MKLIAGAAIMVGTVAGLDISKLMMLQGNRGATGGLFGAGSASTLPFLFSRDDYTTQEQIPLIMAAQGSQNPNLALLFDEDFLESDNFLPFAMSPGFTGYAGSTGMTQRMLPFLTGKFEDKDEIVPFALTGAIDIDSPFMTDYLLDQRDDDITQEDYQLLEAFSGRAPTFGSNPLLMNSFLDDRDKVMTKRDFSFFNTVARGGDLTQNPLQFANFLNDKDDEELSTTDYLVYNAGLSAGGLSAHLPYLLDNDALDQKDLELPMLVNSMAAGGRPSLSNHLIPALQMLDMDVNQANVLPWMHTQGQSYLGYGGFNTYQLADQDLSSSAFLPWMAAGQAAPVTSANPFTTTAPVRQQPIYNAGFSTGNRFGNSFGNSFGNRNYGFGNRNYGFGNGFNGRFTGAGVRTVLPAAPVAEVAASTSD